jgi:hypothetical protein
MIPRIHKKNDEKIEYGKPHQYHTNDGLNTCQDCGGSFKNNAKFVYVDKNCESKLVCEPCVREAVNKKLVIFYDTEDFYEKRYASGFIDKLVKEFQNVRN